MSEERRRSFSSGDVTEKWRPVQFLELLSRKEAASGQEGEQKGRYLFSGSVRGIRSKFNSLRRNLHLGKGTGVKSWGFCV